MAKGSKYYDSTAAIQVIGCIFKQPSLLEDEGTYFFHEEDFCNDFHKVIFGSMVNLYLMGTTYFSIKIIEDYLSNKPESLAIYKAGNGATWLKEQEQYADLANFKYYYGRLKKFTLLREYDKFGLDVKWIYDPDEIFDAKKKEAQEKYLDDLSLEKIAAEIEVKIEGIRRTYIDGSEDNSHQVGQNIFELLNELKKEPEMGPPMYGKYVNAITRGMRLGRLYLRSAATGVGKTRTMVADACYCACDRIYDPQSEQ